MKVKIIFFSLVLLFTTNLTLASSLSNTGLIPGQIWYSQSDLIEGETVNIYTAIWNGSENTITAKVEFYDKNVVLGSKEITISSKSVKEAFVSWKISAGDHLISAKIISSSVKESGGIKSVVLSQTETEKDSQFVSKTIQKEDGTTLASNELVKDQVKNQIENTEEKILEVIPDSIEKPVIEKLNQVDDFREETLDKIVSSKTEAKEVLDELKKEYPQEEIEINNKTKEGTSGTEKPIAILKYFFLSALALIFGHKIIFYGFCLIIIFFIFRFIYRKIRRK